MSSENIDICKLEDLNKLRSAPRLNKKQSEILFHQVENIIYKTDWVTIGVMSPTIEKGINAVRRIGRTVENRR